MKLRRTSLAVIAIVCLAGVVFGQYRGDRGGYGGSGGRRGGGGYGGYRGDPDTELTDRRGVPEWEVDPNFKADVFTFVRIKYSSWGRRWGWATGRWRSRPIARCCCSIPSIWRIIITDWRSCTGMRTGCPRRGGRS